MTRKQIKSGFRIAVGSAIVGIVIGLAGLISGPPLRMFLFLIGGLLVVIGIVEYSQMASLVDPDSDE